MSISICLSKFQKEGLCAGCCGKVSEKDGITEEFKNYREYLASSKLEFKENSVPLCFNCWYRNYEVCGICGFPIISINEVSLSSELLTKTTCHLWDSNNDFVVKENDTMCSYHVCLFCQENRQDEIQRIQHNN